MTIKELLEKMKLKGKKTAAIVGMSAALGATAVGCGNQAESDSAVKTESSIDDTEEVKEETPVVETTTEEVVSENVVETPVADKEIVVEEVTIDMLNTRLAELVTKYEGTFKEEDLKTMLATANCSFMPIETLMDFTDRDMELLENLSGSVLNFVSYNNANMLGYISNAGDGKVLLNPADLYFNSDLIEAGNWVYSQLSNVIGSDKELSIKSTENLNYFLYELEAPGVEVEKAPIDGKNSVFSTSASLYLKDICYRMNQTIAYPEVADVYGISLEDIDAQNDNDLDFFQYLQNQTKSK